MKFERHSAIVTRNTDDAIGLQLRGAVFFQADTLIEGTEYPDPAEPCFGFAGASRKTINGNEKTGSAGFFWVPEPGDFIEVFLEDAVEHPKPQYVNMFYNRVNDIAREFKKNYTKRMGWKTKSGHIILFDDTKDQEILNVEHTFGSRLYIDKDGVVTLRSRKVEKRDNKDEAKDTLSAQLHELVLDYKNKKIFLRDDTGNSLEFTPTGSVWKDKNGNKMTMDAVGIKIEDKNTNKITMNGAGIKIEDKNGNIIEMKGGEIAITAAGKCTVTASGNVEVQGAEIQLNGSAGMVLTTATDPVVDLITGVPTVGVPTVKSG